MRIGGPVKESEMDQACTGLGDPPPSLRTCPVCGKETEPFAGSIDGKWRWIGRCEHECALNANDEDGNELRSKARRAGLDDRDVDMATAWAESSHPVVDRFLSSLGSKGLAATYGLYLNGGVGSGKTVAAKSICLALLGRGARALYTTEPDLFCRLRSSFSDAEATENGMIARYCSPDVLFIDDLGKEKVSEYYAARLFQILDRRDVAGKPTVITTQLPLRALERKLARADADTAAAIASRIKGRYENIVFDGPDKRMRDN